MTCVIWHQSGVLFPPQSGINQSQSGFGVNLAFWTITNLIWRTPNLAISTTRTRAKKTRKNSCGTNLENEPIWQTLRNHLKHVFLHVWRDRSWQSGIRGDPVIGCIGKRSGKRPNLEKNTTCNLIWKLGQSGTCCMERPIWQSGMGKQLPIWICV